MKAIVRDRGVRLVAGLFLLSCAASGWLAWELSPLSNGTDQARYERFFEAR
ncbi:hypothetical protein [Brevundimonas fluminis]|jgi:predicted negative regulator of RcsB-dependent stress response|uniref:hypothetical protein n=1 Tax=Brevundimonas fluminis TaxID=2487274 RepID=UPI0013DDDE02|nr:hypothetical protein [Brevundimonas fluminis]